MAVGDVYEVTDVQEMQGQQCLNVYFYRQAAAFVPLEGTIAQALADEWNEAVLPAIVNTQANEVLHVETRVRNLFNPLDAGAAISGVNGAFESLSEAMTSFDAYGMTLMHDNPTIRPGGKRLAGVPESGQVNGVPTPTAIGFLETAADALAAPITGGLIIADNIMFPVVVKRIREGVDPDFTYRLPETVGELVYGTLLEVLVKLLVTSQVSRKFGIGV